MSRVGVSFKPTVAGTAKGKIYLAFAFVLGCATSSTVLLWMHGPHRLPEKIQRRQSPAHEHLVPSRKDSPLLDVAPKDAHDDASEDANDDAFDDADDAKDVEKANPTDDGDEEADPYAGVGGVLTGRNVLVAIASYDTSQLPHLEEVLASLRDVCEAGVNSIRVVIHTTFPYPVSWIDMINSRTRCWGGVDSPTSGEYANRMQIEIEIVSPAIRLHLVDLHRPLFYKKENLEKYDVMIYLEDDIRVTPSLIAAYLLETKRLRKLAGESDFSDYNIGIVRYEYNFPPDTTIDDNTRHLVKKATRVFWEHSKRPVFPKAAKILPEDERKLLGDNYFHMSNHHQGMFMATPDLLREWAEREGCNFDVVRDRPSKPDPPYHPSEGTQRVWMSSHMLYGPSHCDVRQLLPADNFVSLTTHHLANKNYRRVGKEGRIGGGGVHNAMPNSFEKPPEVEGPSPLLLSAMEMHIEISKSFYSVNMTSYEGIKSYEGILMLDLIDRANWVKDKQDYFALVDRRMKAFEDYVERGGYMVEADYTDLLDDYNAELEEWEAKADLAKSAAKLAAKEAKKGKKGKKTERKKGKRKTKRKAKTNNE
uniref:Uncharacterized protein n=1 Tax=Corethron hystrix TaxID=216773 RepID=A0A7S1B812_9STRA|mmetsp:Transcript_15364/g.34430  ORF Transcript_15364/g.34430 Transcript_15364/m.34430 type:complete len:591 (+) Transcript_15364:152-1924(+)